MTSSPAWKAASALVRLLRRHAALGPIGLMPIISNAIAIVLAVNWPPQAPTPGVAASSIALSSCVVDLARGVRADRLEDLEDRDLLAVVAARTGSSRRRASATGG